MNKKIKILGIKIDVVDFKTTLVKIEQFIKSQKPHQIVTVNPEFVMTAQQDSEFKEVLNKADLSVPDGIGIVWASRLLGFPLKERVAGVDLVEQIAKLAAEKGYSIYFLGGREKVAEKTAFNLKKKFPALKIAGTESGSPYELEIISKIKQASPSVLFVAFGHPKQEKWIYKYKNRLGVPVMIGVGGAFDFISKNVPRAPKWVQNIGLEWLFRLIKQPWRIKRQLALFRFAYLILKEAVRKKLLD